VLQQRKEPVYKVTAESISVSGTTSQLGLLWERTKSPVVNIQGGYRVSFQPSISRLPDWSSLLESSLNQRQRTALEEFPGVLPPRVSSGSAMPPQKPQQPAQEEQKQMSICWQNNAFSLLLMWTGKNNFKKAPRSSISELLLYSSHAVNQILSWHGLTKIDYLEHHGPFSQILTEVSSCNSLFANNLSIWQVVRSDPWSWKEITWRSAGHINASKPKRKFPLQSCTILQLRQYHLWKTFLLIK